MNRITSLLAVLAVAACNSPAALDDRWADPRSIDYAESLNVDLSQMNLTPTGLYWQDLEVGTGLTAEVGNRVIVHYTGWLPDGTMFDTSREGAGLFDFILGVGLVIKGWDEGVVGMKVGGTRKLVIPPSLAYGRAGRNTIPPLATLIFEIELFQVVK